MCILICHLIPDSGSSTRCWLQLEQVLYDVRKYDHLAGGVASQFRAHCDECDIDYDIKGSIPGLYLSGTDRRSLVPSRFGIASHTEFIPALHLHTAARVRHWHCSYAKVTLAMRRVLAGRRACLQPGTAINEMNCSHSGLRFHDTSMALYKNKSLLCPPGSTPDLISLCAQLTPPLVVLFSSRSPTPCRSLKYEV